MQLVACGQPPGSSPTGVTLTAPTDATWLSGASRGASAPPAGPTGALRGGTDQPAAVDGARTRNHIGMTELLTIALHEPQVGHSGSVYQPVVDKARGDLVRRRPNERGVAGGECPFATHK